MNTARTVQVLDANNNNISPATCIDSLYFEMIDNQTTYRMALRDKFIVAGKGLNSSNPYNEDYVGKLEDVSIPYVYCESIKGAEFIYQLKKDTA